MCCGKTGITFLDNILLRKTGFRGWRRLVLKGGGVRPPEIGSGKKNKGHIGIILGLVLPAKRQSPPPPPHHHHHTVVYDYNIQYELLNW